MTLPKNYGGSKSTTTETRLGIGANSLNVGLNRNHDRNLGCNLWNFSKWNTTYFKIR